MPEKVAPTTQGPTANPYGIGAVHQPGVVPATNASPYSTTTPGTGRDVGNRPAWLSLLFGVLSVGITLVSFLPGSTTLWVSGAGLVAILWGVVAISRRAHGRATNVWAPILGILFGLTATAITLLGIGLTDIVTSATGGTPDAATTASTVVVPTRPVSAEPLVFAANAPLTEDGTAVQTIATALNQHYASGNSTLTAGQAWPRSLEQSGSQVLADSSTPLATVPAGDSFTYHVASDGKSYTLSVSTGDHTESAIYDSGANHFTFACAATDTSCVPVH